MATNKSSKKTKRQVSTGLVKIKASFNNTHVTITDSNGEVLSWSSAGVVGFKGSKKSTPFAAQVAAEDAVQKVVSYGLKDVDVEVCGPGAGRETAIRSLQSAGLNVKSITDTTPIPHNGCRAKKPRRV